MTLLGLASVTTTLCQPSNTKPVPVPSVPSTLNITTLTAENGFSVLECWSLVPGFTTSHQAGTSGAASIGIGELGSSTANATFSIIPARFNGGIHNAPAAQWVIFLSGLAHITLPNSTDKASIQGGKHGTILALDTSDVSNGHITDYPTDEVTTAVQIPLEDGKIPGHVKLHNGSCTPQEQNF
ncbi:hypothetical protein V8E54_000838 [Elaphomyces granulatus]